MRQIAVIGVFAAALAISNAGNAANLVANGDFDNPGVTPNNYLSMANVPPWFAEGAQAFMVIFAPGGADVNATDVPTLHLWGPHNGGPTVPGVIGGLPTQVLPATSPNGNNYLAVDADPSFVGPNSINQMIPTSTGSYVLNFDYAAAQYTDETGKTQDAWQVSLGGKVVGGVVTGGTVLIGPGSSTLNGKTTTTPVLSIPSQGFSGWKTDTVNFAVPTGSPVSELLSFLAVGTPAGLPPAVLLDSVSILPGCVSGTAASYIGTTCAIGDKEFSNFKYTSTAIGSAIASSALQTTISPVNSGNNEGFNIQGIFDAGPGGAADGVLSYTVQSLAGNTIDDAGLTIAGSAIGGGFATVGETICEGDLLSDGCASGTSATLQASLPGSATDSITFPGTDLVDVIKDIDVFGGTGFASLSDIINTVSQDPPDPPPVPEPASLALLGVGMAGLAGALVRRKRY